MDPRNFLYISLFLCGCTSVLTSENIGRIHNKLRDIHVQLNALNEELTQLSNRNSEPDQTSPAPLDLVLVDQQESNDEDDNDDELVARSRVDDKATVVPDRVLRDVALKVREAEAHLQDALTKLSQHHLLSDNGNWKLEWQARQQKRRGSRQY